MSTHPAETSVASRLGTPPKSLGHRPGELLRGPRALSRISAPPLLGSIPTVEMAQGASMHTVEKSPKRTTLAERAYQEIRARIIDNRLAP